MGCDLSFDSFQQWLYCAEIRFAFSITIARQRFNFHPHFPGLKSGATKCFAATQLKIHNQSEYSLRLSG